MTQPPSFIPCLEFARRFYWEAVRPILDIDFPDLRHSAALIDTGSEVLGFDTPMSCYEDCTRSRETGCVTQVRLSQADRLLTLRS